MSGFFEGQESIFEGDPDRNPKCRILTKPFGGTCRKKRRKNSMPDNVILRWFAAVGIVLVPECHMLSIK